MSDNVAWQLETIANELMIIRKSIATLVEIMEN
jgi:hypothetical protein